MFIFENYLLLFSEDEFIGFQLLLSIRFPLKIIMTLANTLPKNSEQNYSSLFLMRLLKLPSVFEYFHLRKPDE